MRKHRGGPLRYGSPTRRFEWSARWVRFEWRLPEHLLNIVCEGVFVEADLCEEWVIACREAGIDPHSAEQSFHEWIRAESGGIGTRQEALRDPQHRATVRREMRDKMKEFGQE